MELNFIKNFGLILITLGLLLTLSVVLYMGANPEMIGRPELYNVGIVAGVGIGFSLTGGILRLYSAKNS